MQHTAVQSEYNKFSLSSLYRRLKELTLQFPSSTSIEHPTAELLRHLWNITATYQSNNNNSLRVVPCQKVEPLPTIAIDDLISRGRKTLAMILLDHSMNTGAIHRFKLIL